MPGRTILQLLEGVTLSAQGIFGASWFVVIRPDMGPNWFQVLVPRGMKV